MAPDGDPDIWQLLFEQTPVAVRWTLGIMTFGMFSLVGVIYRINREDIREIHSRIDRLEYRINERLDEVNAQLLEIARNTRRR